MNSQPDTPEAILDKFASYFPWKAEDLKASHWEQAHAEAKAALDLLYYSQALEAARGCYAQEITDLELYEYQNQEPMPAINLKEYEKALAIQFNQKGKDD